MGRRLIPYNEDNIFYLSLDFITSFFLNTSLQIDKEKQSIFMCIHAV